MEFEMFTFPVEKTERKIKIKEKKNKPVSLSMENGKKS